jgi:hypothetical protein
MSATPTAITVRPVGLFQRIKSFSGAATFLLIRRFPKLIQLHRNQKSWTLLRIALGCFGAALVVLPLSLWQGWITAIFGLFLFVASILLPPAQLESDTDRKANELGAHIIVSGGRYQPGNGLPTEARLFISPAHVWALDTHFNPLVVVQTSEISLLSVEPRENAWVLRARWAEHKAEFWFEGFFAERFARLAEDSIRASLPGTASPAPLVKTHAAGV